MNIKNIMNNVKERINNSNTMEFIKNKTEKITSNEKVSGIMNSMKERFKNIKNSIDSFDKKIQNVMAYQVIHRFCEKIGKKINKIKKKIFGEKENGKKSIIGKIVNVVCKILTIAFIGLVIYCMKDVFLNVLMLVATCAAIALSIEFIMSVLSVGFGCKI